MRFRRFRTALSQRRSFLSVTRGPECGPSSRLRTKRTTAGRMPSTDGAGALSLDSRTPSAEPHTFRSAVRPGSRSSDGRSGRVPCTRHPSDRWYTPTTACGTLTGARSHSVNAWSFRRATIVPVLVTPALVVRVCRPVRSVRSPWTATMRRAASPTFPGLTARCASGQAALPGTLVPRDGRRRTPLRRPRSTCGHSSMPDCGRWKETEALAPFCPVRGRRAARILRRAGSKSVRRPSGVPDRGAKSRVCTADHTAYVDANRTRRC